MTNQVPQSSSRSNGKAFLWPLAVVFLVMGFALFGDRGILHLLQLHNQKTAFELDLAEVERQNEQLRKEINALGSDRRYIERVARTDLGMVRDDELVFQFSEQPGRLSAGSATTP